MIDYNLAEIFAPMQIMIVLVLALLLFGPKRLPELGKQIGSALRDFNKAKSDMMKHLSLDHEPEHTYQPPPDESYYNTYDPSHYQAPPDLTSYTIVTNPPEVKPAEGVVAHAEAAIDTNEGPHMGFPHEQIEASVAASSPQAHELASHGTESGSTKEHAAV